MNDVAEDNLRMNKIPHVRDCTVSSFAIEPYNPEPVRNRAGA